MGRVLGAGPNVVEGDTEALGEFAAIHVLHTPRGANFCLSLSVRIDPTVSP
jgi:H2-forming N5,N10-methylenetetrahydromethanopterin dehydrogenase-like enzyme